MDPRKWRHTLARATPSKRYPQLKGGYNRAPSACRACSSPTRGARDDLCGACWQLVTPAEKARYMEHWRAERMREASAVMRTIVHRLQSLAGALAPAAALHDLIDRGIQTR